jgi:ABC-2 type transport system permease protein
MKPIFHHTIIQALRQRYLQIFSIVLMLLFIVVAINSSIAFKTREASFEQARQAVRQSWLDQGPQNPHSAAHYGHYIFQPVDALQFLDNGARNFTGTVIRLEGHKQNEAAFSAAENRSELSRFGDTSFAWMLQVLFPLFIILLCFGAVSSDKESGNLKLLSAQGLSYSYYLWGKIAGYYSIVLTLMLAGLLLQIISYAFAGGSLQEFPFGRLALWTLFYAIYLFIITGFSVLLSSWLTKSSSSLLMQLSLWVVLLILIPRITASAGERLNPMEYRTAFNQQLSDDRKKGIDGHNPSDERIKRFKDSLLTKYGVDTLQQLPINADGLIMQADEEYGNMVYDKHLGRIRSTIEKQNSISRWSSFVNPFLAIRNISMGVSASDYRSSLTVADSAEQYRRRLIEELNLKMAYGGSKTGDWNWKVDGSYWASVPDFEYPHNALSAGLAPLSIELTALLFWIILLFAAVFFTAKKLNPLS